MRMSNSRCLELGHDSFFQSRQPATRREFEAPIRSTGAAAGRSSTRRYIKTGDALVAGVPVLLRVCGPFTRAHRGTMAPTSSCADEWHAHLFVRSTATVQTWSLTRVRRHRLGFPIKIAFCNKNVVVVGRQVHRSLALSGVTTRSGYRLFDASGAARSRPL